MGQAKTLRGEVNRGNNGFCTFSGDLSIPATSRTSIYGKGSKASQIVGYSYTFEHEGVTYTGKAKGPQESITLKPAKNNK